MRFCEKFEQWLDVGSGSCILRESEIRAVVEQSLRHFSGDRYGLNGYVIMPNHVHVLVTPFREHTLSKIIKGWKSVSTREINKLQRERGGDTASTIKKSGVIWQKESFDHIVRNPESLEKFSKYIDENPAELSDGEYGLYSRERDGDIASTVTEKQQAVVDVLKDASPVLLSELTVQADVSVGTVKTLEKKGLVTLSKESIYRDPHEGVEILKTPPLTLMPEQADALKTILGAMNSEKPETILLHGVTGSGKTEVYLQAIAHALEQGQGAIVLVPEIALTPQTVDRFRARFADQAERVAVLHSSLSDGERYDEWHRIRSGEATIVIGARSALFAPVENIGLIVVDEEHEPTYKQDETPRYSARDAAVMRGHRENCAVVLGSATPALESYCNAKTGKYTYVDMPSRVDDRKMPEIRVVDMRLEKDREGQHGLFSKELIHEIYARLDRAEQTMIFLNRRGFSASLVCPDCGYVSECEHCSVKLTYHKARRRLICHTCGDERAAPDRCPECESKEFKYSGAGTEKIEEVMAKLFPKANIARMDSDTMRRKNAHRDILAKFRLGKIDILIGTQMIAKGLDFPNVTLVGVVNPDHALHMADFRAGERVFQLLTQVSGRAGRGEVEGEVLVQTYTPHHPAIQFARRMDFDGFCDQELAFRKELFYPPYAHLTCITLRGK
ncbi:MAG: primosomal protein N', partial [Gammaproteobacteria bacterium]|nr:primosomal protein N' [Gammaproteobacteria bacterium]